MAALARAGALAGALAFAVLAGLGWRGETLPKSEVQPSRAAFGIWGVIYTAVLASVASLALGHDAPASAVGLLCASLVLCGAWLLLVQRARAVSLVAIALAFACATASVLGARAPMTPRAWAFAIGPGLLAGWLAVAWVLGALLVRPAGRAASVAWLAASAAAVLVVGALAGNPAPAAAVLWAALFLPVGPAPFIIASSVGLVLAVAR